MVGKINFHNVDKNSNWEKLIQSYRKNKSPEINDGLKLRVTKTIFNIAVEKKRLKKFR